MPVPPTPLFIWQDSTGLPSSVTTRSGIWPGPTTGHWLLWGAVRTHVPLLYPFHWLPSPVRCPCPYGETPSPKQAAWAFCVALF